MKQFVQHIQVKIIQFFENRKIMKCKLVDASLDRTADLARHTEGILMIDQKKGQVIMPQISCKSIRSGDFNQSVYAFIKLSFHFTCIHC